MSRILGELWRQMIGVLGLFDTVLQHWTYPAISGLVLCTFAVAGITMLVYIVAIYLISYLVFTPLNANTVWGVQGRYFVPILSLAAFLVAAFGNHTQDQRLGAALAISAAMLSGGASVEAILRADWNWR